MFEAFARSGASANSLLKNVIADAPKVGNLRPVQESWNNYQPGIVPIFRYSLEIHIRPPRWRVLGYSGLIVLRLHPLAIGPQIGKRHSVILQRGFERRHEDIGKK